MKFVYAAVIGMSAGLVHYCFPLAILILLAAWAVIMASLVLDEGR